MQQRLPSLLDEPIAFAHRGASAHSQENTLEAFALALRLGANGLETDAWVTRDNHVVLDHDGIVRRRTRKVPISQVDRADLPGHIPTFSDLLDSLGSTRCHISIDVKDRMAGALIVDTLMVSGFDPALIWLCFHRLADVLEARRNFPGVRIVDSTRLSRLTEGVERRAAILAENNVDALNMHHTDWNGGLVTLVHRFGVHAFGWDMQQEHVLVSGFRMGLDAVYSDHVDRMVQVYTDVIGCSPGI